MKLPTVFDHDHDHVRLKVRNCGATPVTIQPVHALLVVCDQTQSTDESPTLELVFDPQQDNPALNPASQALPGQYAALLRSGDGIGMDCSVPGLPDTHLHLEMVLRAEHETPLDLSVTVAGEPACVRRITVSPDPIAFNLDAPCPEEPARLDLRCTNVGDFATSIRVDWPQCSIIAGSMGPGDLSSRIGAGQSVGDGI